jgi:hypothetical protein
MSSSPQESPAGRSDPAAAGGAVKKHGRLGWQRGIGVSDFALSPEAPGGYVGQVGVSAWVQNQRKCFLLRWGPPQGW